MITKIGRGILNKSCELGKNRSWYILGGREVRNWGENPTNSKSKIKVLVEDLPKESWNSLGNNTGVGCHSVLQGNFSTQRSNPGLPHCRQIHYCLSHQGSPYPSQGFWLWPSASQCVFTKAQIASGAWRVSKLFLKITFLNGGCRWVDC